MQHGHEQVLIREYHGAGLGNSVRLQMLFEDAAAELGLRHVSGGTGDIDMLWFGGNSVFQPLCFVGYGSAAEEDAGFLRGILTEILVHIPIDGGVARFERGV
ncbi:MAG TPA: hypothetical protein PKM88_13980, partial [bacterium]|nr:hypothetical protein [bacterium]